MKSMRLRGALVLAVVFVSALLVAGCGAGEGGDSAEQDGELTLGNIGWTENEAIANLSKIVMEEDLGYAEVEVQLADLAPVFQGVGSGEMDAFQDVWMPNHEQELASVEDDVELLNPWYDGVTEFGIAVPDYMEIQSLEELPEAETNEITGIEPGAAFHPQIQEEVIPTYAPEMELVESSTQGMLSELDRAYSNEEPIVFIPWSPHWMNDEYDFHYLEDPENAQGEFDEPSEIATVVNNDLAEEDPAAYAFMQEMTMTEDQMNALLADINEAEDPLDGARTWLEEDENREIVQPWIDAAEEAQQE